MNPNLKEQYTNNLQIYLEKQIAPGFRARTGWTYVYNPQNWIQIPSGMPYSAWSVPYTAWDRGEKVSGCLQTGATNPCGTTGTPYTVWDIAPQYKSAQYSQSMYVNREYQNDHFNSIEFTADKRPANRSGKYSITGSYTATRNHKYLNTVTGNQGPQPIFTSPNQLRFPLDATWNWQVKLNGSYRMPLAISVTASYNLYSGLQGMRILSLNLPNSGNQTFPVEEYGSQVAPTRPTLNLRLSRNFKKERMGTWTPSAEILNATNSSSPWTINSSSGGQYTSGPSFLKYTALGTPLIARFNLVWVF